jgi:hypothetical protein
VAFFSIALVMETCRVQNLLFVDVVDNENLLKGDSPKWMKGRT